MAFGDRPQGLDERDRIVQEFVVQELTRWAGKYDMEKTRRRITQLLSQGFDAMFDGTRPFAATVEAPEWVATVTSNGIALAKRLEEPEPAAELPGDLSERLARACAHTEDERCVDAVRALLREASHLTPEQVYVIVATANRRLGFSPTVAATSGMATRGSVRGASWMAMFYAKGFDVMPTAQYAPEGGQDARAEVREYAALVRKYLEGAGANADWGWLRKIVQQRTSALGIVRPPRLPSLYIPTIAVALDPLRKVTMYGPHVVLEERAHEDAPWREPHNAA